jgi:hypothetical protein
MPLVVAMREVPYNSKPEHLVQIIEIVSTLPNPYDLGENSTYSVTQFPSFSNEQSYQQLADLGTQPLPPTLLEKLPMHPTFSSETSRCF